MNGIITGILLLALIATGFSFGVYYGQGSIEPVEKVVYVEVTKEYPDYKPVLAYKDYVIKGLSIEASALRNKLTATWEKNTHLGVEIVALRTRLALITTRLENSEKYGGLQPFKSSVELMRWLYQNDISEREYKFPSYVCSDFARDLVIDAIKDGKLIGLSRIKDQLHQKNFTIIGNTIWEIEPTNDGVKKVGAVYHGWEN